MTRLGSQLILSGMGMLVCIWHWPVDLMAEEPLMGYWRNFPVAHGTPLEPLPPKEELLKVVPPLRDPRVRRERRTRPDPGRLLLPATTRASCSGRSLSPVGQFSDCLAKTAELRAELEDVLPGLSDMLTSTEAVNDTLPEENRGQNTRSLLK